MHDQLVDAIDQWLPQTQCTQCGYPRCLDYAQAIAEDEAGINRCPPGDDITITGLSKLLDLPVIPLDPTCGSHKSRVMARIDESTCIGCTLCLDACPVDAIVGAKNMMHTVISKECTGCELCLPPCPVDCIDLIPAKATQAGGKWPEYTGEQVKNARRRTQMKLLRLSALETNRKLKKHHRQAQRKPKLLKAEIVSAIQRTRQKRLKAKPN